MGREAPVGSLAPWQLKWTTCAADLMAYRQLLYEQADLSERDDVLPFFREHADLAALLGTYHPNIESYDRLGVEVRLFGEYVADIVIGDRANNWSVSPLMMSHGAWGSVCRPGQPHLCQDSHRDGDGVCPVHIP